MRARVRPQLLAALAVAILAWLSSLQARAAVATMTWLPAAGAMGYRIEKASKAAGPWKLARDVLPQTVGRPSDLQVQALDGLRAGAPLCVRVSTVWPASQVSLPTAPVCVTVAKFADVAFGTLTPGAPGLPPMPAPALAWVYCAGEGEQCAFAGAYRVRFGRADTWAVLTLTNGAGCNRELFGDPAPGFYKTCEVEK